MLIGIDGARCMGHGRCYSAAPDILSDDEEGFVAQAGQEVAVPETARAQAREAVEACPEAAITVLRTADSDA